MEIHSYRDLKIWQEGIGLVKGCYCLTHNFPKDELFGLTSQIRRASVSIPANIAEGHGRESTGEFIQFLRIAQGSLKELETHLILTKELEICQQAEVLPLLNQTDQIGRMIRSLIRTLQNKR